MEIQTITFDIEIIQDSSLQNNIDGILNSINNEVQKGNVVLIEKRFDSEQPVFIMKISSTEDLEMFKNQFLFPQPTN